jgi:hypothetical protein
MRAAYSILALILCVSCSMSNNQGLSTLSSSEVNIQRMSRLIVGMGQLDVLELMRRPYSYESFQIDKDTYDVWFYVTMPTVLGQSRLVPQNLTPLAFKNGVLIGWGYRYYNSFVKNKGLPEKESKKPASPEDKALEKPLDQPVAMSDRKAPQDPPKKKGEESGKKEEDDRPPSKDSQEMLEDDSEYDFNTW